MYMLGVETHLDQAEVSFYIGCARTTFLQGGEHLLTRYSRAVSSSPSHAQSHTVAPGLFYPNSLCEVRPLHCPLNGQNSYAVFIGGLESSAGMSICPWAQQGEIISWQQAVGRTRGGGGEEGCALTL